MGAIGLFIIVAFGASMGAFITGIVAALKDQASLPKGRSIAEIEEDLRLEHKSMPLNKPSNRYRLLFEEKRKAMKRSTPKEIAEAEWQTQKRELADRQLEQGKSEEEIAAYMNKLDEVKGTSNMTLIEAIKLAGNEQMVNQYKKIFQGKTEEEIAQLIKRFRESRQITNRGFGTTPIGLRLAAEHNKQNERNLAAALEQLKREEAEQQKDSDDGLSDKNL